MILEFLIIIFKFCYVTDNSRWDTLQMYNLIMKKKRVHDPTQQEKRVHVGQEFFQALLRYSVCESLYFCHEKKEDNYTNKTLTEITRNII